MDWQLADAKNKFSEVVNKALTEGPQRVRRRKDTVYVVSAEEYERLNTQTQSAKKSFKEWLFNGPPLHELDLERDQSPPRDIDL